MLIFSLLIAGVLLTGGGVLAQRHVDNVGQCLDTPLHHGEVPLVNLAVLELAGEPPVGGLGLGEGHDAGRVTVETVHDAGPRELLADTGQRPARLVAEVPR